MELLISILPIYMVTLPLFLSMSSLAIRLFGVKSESYTTTLTAIGMILLFGTSILNLSLVAGTSPGMFNLFSWYHIDHHAFEFIIENNIESALFAFAFSGIAAVVGFFSRTYLHRDSGFAEFFALYPLFCSGSLLVAFAHNLDTVVVGWELVALTSVLLISFYRTRRTPLESSTYTLVMYRIGDVCLLAALTILHVDGGVHDFSTVHTHSDASAWILIFAAFACFIKSGAFPFCSWLPRAMEGPTPSSAIFYGGIATHLGPLLLIKLSPLLQQFPNIEWFILSVGLVTALYAAGVGRTTPDVKTQLAYATIAQIGVIYTEVALGFYKLAIYHTIVHCSVRTFQFLKCPSILHDFNKLNLEPNKFRIENFLPSQMRKKLYFYARARFFLDDFIQNIIVLPFLSCCAFIASIERKFAGKDDTISTQSDSSELIKDKNYAAASK